MTNENRNGESDASPRFSTENPSAAPSSPSSRSPAGTKRSSPLRLALIAFAVLAFGGIVLGLRLTGDEKGTSPPPSPSPVITPVNAANAQPLMRFDKGNLETLALSPDGTLLAAGGAGGLWLFDMTTHTEVWEQTSEIGVMSVAFAPDGQTLATGSASTRVRIWRVADGALLQTITGHTYRVWSVAFAPDGQTLATGSSDGVVRLWRIADGALLRTFAVNNSEILHVVFAPNGQMLASISWDGGMQLWRVADGRLLRVFKQHSIERTITAIDRTITSVAFTPDSQTLAIGIYERTVRDKADLGTVQVWRITYGQLLYKLTENLLTKPVTSLAFAPDGQTLAIGSYKTVDLWRITDDWHQSTGVTPDGTVWYVAFTPDGQTLVTGSLDGTA